MGCKVVDLSFSYRNNKVLSDINFSFEKGELVCLLGPNGVGKSTLFKNMLGLLKPSFGEILVDGKNIRELKSRERARYFAYIPQYTNPVFDYTVFEMVLMGTTSLIGEYSSPSTREKKLAQKAIELLGIENIAYKRCREISGGERQLALIARAVASDSKYLLMDEPTASLDFGNTLRVLNMISALSQKGYGIVMSTHSPNEAYTYGTRALMLNKGKVLCYGKPSEVINIDAIKELYGIDVTIEKIYQEEKEYLVCIPKGNNGLSLDKK